MKRNPFESRLLSPFARVRLQLTALTVTVVLVIYVVSSVAVYMSVRETVMSSSDGRLFGIVDRIEHHGWRHVLPLPPGTYFLYAQADVVRTNLSKRATTGLFGLMRHQNRQQPWQVNWYTGGGMYRIVYTPMMTNSIPPLQVGSIVVIADISREVGVLRRLAQVLLLVGVLGGASATLGGFVLAERALRPIRNAWQKQLEFVANASHELRTPLSVIQSNLGIVLEHTDQTVVENLEWLNNVHSESRRLNRMVEDLLTLARSDSEQMPIRRNSVRIADVVSRVGELFEFVADSKHVTLDVQASGSAVVEGDEDRLQQLLIILLDNAVKYTPAGGHVRVSTDQQRGHAIVTVADTGIGIAEKDIPHVFERFYRADMSRTRYAGETLGVGLGLSIAKWIVEAHQGRISISSKEGVGTKVTVQLPLSTTAPRASK